MNYIQQMNTFFRIAGSAELSPSSRILYLALLNKDNSLGWIPTFTCSADEIKGLSGLSQSAFQRSRQQLIEKKLIYYKKRGSNRAPRYEIPELTNNLVLSILNNTPNSKTDNTPNNSPNITPDNTPNTLVKTNQTKSLGSSTPATPNNINNAPTRESVTEKITQEFGRGLSPMELKYLDGLFQGSSPVLVDCALQEAVLHQAYSFKYIASVLNAFKKRGITNREQYEQTVQERNKQNQSDQPNKPVNGPDIPLFSITGGT